MIERVAVLSFLIIAQTGSQPWVVDKLVAIEYPREALTANVEGDVMIQCRISNNGDVSDAIRVSGLPHKHSSC